MSSIVIIGGGPAGLMAAEVIASAGLPTIIYDHMPSLGRKFLMAGRGGLNLTHSEPLEALIKRYSIASSWLEPVIRNFPPDALRDWCHGLEQSTFVGTSGRVFPTSLKASPLLRAWLRRLDKLGVRFALKQKWMGWDDNNRLIFMGPNHKQEFVKAPATLLALGGASWPRLGSDGDWVDILTRHNIPVTPLAPANCGFIAPWSDIFRQRFEGQPLKPITLSLDGITIPGEAIITAKGLEGGAVYALSARLREKIATTGAATLHVDLRPGLSIDELTSRLQSPRGSQSFSNFMRKFSGLSPVALGLLYENVREPPLQSLSPQDLARIIKACPVRLTAPASIERAISTAGGIKRDALDERFMLLNKTGVFVAGEMLDWEAPTGGYLLQASIGTAVAAAQGLLAWVKHSSTSEHEKI